MNNNLLPEPLENEAPRLAILPIKYPDIMDRLERATALIWVAKDIDNSLNIDSQNVHKLEPDVKRLLEHLLAFFAVSDGLVNNNIEHCFSNITVLEVKMWYHFQEAMEDIHNLVYSNLVLTYTGDRYLTVLDAVANYPAIANKVDFIKKHIAAPRLGKQIFMNCIMEGLFFSASFCVIFWINHTHDGKLPGLAMANEYISRDEGLHTELSMHLYNKHVVNKLPQSEAHDLIKEAIQVEIQFINDALPENLKGMNSTLMIQYLQFVADQLLRNLNYEPIWNVEQPFPFMQKQSVGVRVTDFFVNTPTDYGLSSFKTNTDDNVIVFD